MIALFGLGVSIKSVAKYLNSKKIDFYLINLGPVHTWPSLDDIDVKVQNCIAQNDIEQYFDKISQIIISPGIPTKLPLIQKAKSHGIEVISEIEFAFRLSSVPVIAVTGTNGKTTVCEMLHLALKMSDKEIFLGGNIGIPYTNILLAKNKNFDYAIIEVSSFQLENIDSFAPHIAIITNITPSHMERYDSFNEYRETKLKIFENQKSNDVFISEVETTCEKQVLPHRADFDFNKAKAKGEHNQKNFKLVYTALTSLGLANKELFQTFIERFTPSPYRVEKVHEFDGHTFYNDGKSTNLESTIAALSVFKGLSVNLILGGKLRERDFNFDKLFEGQFLIEKIYAFGEARDLIKTKLEDNFEIEVNKTLSETVISLDIRKSKITLFSPCFPSFDLYSNYIERGEDFNQLVKKRFAHSH